MALNYLLSLVAYIVLLVNSEEERPNRRPDIGYQVSVQVHAFHYCGGTIIGSRWVLTAAFCTSGLIAKSLTVRVGSNSIRKGGSVLSVSRIIQHDNYTSYLHENDFSLLELAEPLNFNSKVQVMQLPDVNESFQDGSSCLVSGWGIHKYARSNRDKFIASAASLVNKEQCKQAYISIHDITESMVCADSSKKRICRSDEGSPLVCRNGNSDSLKLIGTVSWSEGCGDSKYPGVYGRVQAVRSWIEQNTGI